MVKTEEGVTFFTALNFVLYTFLLMHHFWD